MKLSSISVVGCLAIVLAVPGMRAQQAGSAQQRNASPADKAFIRNALEGSNAEFELGQLAQQRANSQDVRQFGEKMVTGHTQLNEEMKPVAEQAGVSAPAHIAPADMALEAKLETLSGSTFDKVYMKAMVKDHRKDLAEFRHESKNGQSSAVKNAARQGSQALHEHLQLALKVAHQVGAIGENQINKTGSRSISTPMGPQ